MIDNDEEDFLFDEYFINRLFELLEKTKSSNFNPMSNIVFNGLKQQNLE